MVDAPRKALPVSTPFDLPFSAKVFSVGDVFDSQAFAVTIPDNIYIEVITFSIDFDTAAGVRGTDAGSVRFSRGGLIFLSVPAFKLTNNLVGRMSWGQFGAAAVTATGFQAWLQLLPQKLHLYPDDMLSFNFPSFVAGDVFGALVFHGHTWEVY